VNAVRALAVALAVHLAVPAGSAGADPGVEGAQPDERDGATTVVTDTGTELGTTYDVVLVVPVPDVDRARGDLERARERLRALEARLSEWRPDSEISRLNRDGASGPVPLSPELRRILEGAMEVSRVTDGAFDVTWRGYQALWDSAAVRDRLPTEVELSGAAEAVGADRLRVDVRGARFTHPGVVLGIAAVAKGWILDAVFGSLVEAGHTRVMVNVGGDLRVRGRGPDGRRWPVRIQDPLDPARVAAVLRIEEGAAATSGNYLRRRRIEGRTIGHVLDPRTGWPASFTGSVTVLAPDAAMADALATGLLVLGPVEGIALVRRLDGVDAIYVDADGIRSTMASEDDAERRE